MKKTMLVALMMVAIASLVLVSMAQQAQQGGQRRGGGGMMGGMNFQQMREARDKAMNGLIENVAKLKTMQEAGATGMQNRADFQNMSEEERNQWREARTKQREEQTKLYQDIESQLLMLKGPRQMVTDHRTAMEELTAIRDQAEAEKATKTVEMLNKLMETKQAAYDNMLKTLGFMPPQQQ